MDIEELLKRYKQGEVALDEVKHQLEHLPYEDMDFAKLDHHRQLRNGYGEVVYCDGKVTEHLVAIYQRLAEANSNVLGTRASAEQYMAVRAVLPEVTYDSVSRIMKLQHKDIDKVGTICVCTGGTADVPVAEEAAQTAEFFGNHVVRVYDVGVAGIHRLLDNLDVIRQANCVIAVAGMEGALPGVIAGLVQTPVIGVPTSVGYGTGYQGASAILTMLNSCSNGIATVNIDNGYGAAYLASQINHQTGEPKPWYQESDQLLENAHIMISDGYHYASESMGIYHWMLRLFAENYPVKKKELQLLYEAWKEDTESVLSAMQTQSMQSYTVAVHSLKSNARSVGANRLADICYEHELHSREGDLSYVQTHWTELMQEWKIVIAGIWDYFGEEDFDEGE